MKHLVSHVLGPGLMQFEHRFGQFCFRQGPLEAIPQGMSHFRFGVAANARVGEEVSSGLRLLTFLVLKEALRYPKPSLQEP